MIDYLEETLAWLLCPPSKEPSWIEAYLTWQAKLMQIDKTYTDQSQGQATVRLRQEYLCVVVCTCLCPFIIMRRHGREWRHVKKGTETAQTDRPRAYSKVPIRVTTSTAVCLGGRVVASVDSDIVYRRR